MHFKILTILVRLGEPLTCPGPSPRRPPTMACDGRPAALPVAAAVFNVGAFAPWDWGPAILRWVKMWTQRGKSRADRPSS